MSDPLWPQPIPIIGLTGEYASGKTLFGLTIAPKETLVYDTEKSAESYRSLGFERVDIPAEMLAKHPKGYKPIDTYLRWVESVRNLPRGKFKVIVLDTASEIESGLADWVQSHPQEFGRTAGQYAKMTGLMWGDVKEHWKAILSDLASRCETFVFTTHMGNVWSGERPTGKRKPKGKETLMELASLYLHLERRADDKGRVPDKPAATVLKSRLATARVGDGGEIEVIPTLPPRLPVATPAAIRAYMLKPPDYAKLKKDELAPERMLTDDERLHLQVAKAEAEKETELLRLERLHKTQAASQPVRPATPEPTPNGSGHVAGKATEAQLTELAQLRTDLMERGLTDDQWRAAVKKRGADKARDLDESKAADLIAVLCARRAELKTAERAAADAAFKS